MSDAVKIWEQPKAKEINMLAGWRQWADAGSISSGLPLYLVKQFKARQIGSISPEGYYLFQFPGTHDLVRPVVKFKDGFPRSLETRRNEIFYAGDDRRGLVFFRGDEPHLDVERYVAAVLEVAQSLKVRRIVGFGGVYGELPYDKERMVSAIYSQKELKEELEDLAVNLSDYHGGASIGSYVCRRAHEAGLEFVSFYAFVPTYDFSNVAQISNTIRIENDYMAWLAVMRRVDYMLKLGLDLTDLERKSEHLVDVVTSKVDELDGMAPQLGVREYLAQLSEQFEEVTFNPLADVWEEELRRLDDKFEDPQDG
jgi:proteasome assembly chaperone (PAC2) family protein